MTKSSNQLEDDSKTLQCIYAALGHAIRFDIINYLGTFHRPVAYTELVEWLHVKPGSFYFHMKKLKHLVDQDEEKRFYLTVKGNLALEIIKSGQDIRLRSQSSETSTIDENIVPPNRFSIKLFGELVRRSAFNTQFKIFIIFILIGQVLLLELSKLGMIPFFMDGNLYIGLIVCVFELFISFLVVWILLELIMRFYSPIKGYSYELLVGIPLAMSPLFFYPLLVIIAENGFFPFLSLVVSSPSISIAIIFVLQVTTAFFLIQLLQVIKSVNFERALVPVFMILYGFSILSFLVSSFF